MLQRLRAPPLCVIIALLCGSLPAAAQEPAQNPVARPASPPRFVHEVWTVKDGLPVNSVNAVLQSHTGYLWLGTFDGLVRFDGARFTVFNAGNSDNLPSNRIVTLIETRDGSLWLLTDQNHLVRFRNGRFTHFGPDRGLEDISTTELYEDADGTLWVGTSHGVGYIRNDRFVPVARDEVAVTVSSLLRSSDGALWVGTSGHGLFRIRRGQPTTRFTVADGLESMAVTALLEARDGSIWIGTAAGVDRYRDGGIGQIAPESRALQSYVRGFHTAPGESAIWISTDSGVYVFDGGRLRRLPGQEVRGRLTAILSDPAGSIWYGLGTELYRDGRLTFRLGSPPPDDPTPVLDIRAIAQDHEGSLWIGTSAGGLHRLKPAVFTVYGEPEGIAHRNVYPIFQDRSGALWFGTWGRGLNRLAGDTIINYTSGDGVPDFVRSILQDDRGRLWVGGLASVVACTLPEMACAEPAGWPAGERDAFALHQDRSGAIWVGSSDGLYRLEEGEWRRFGTADGVPPGVVRAFLEARDGSLWMGTNGGGLLRYRDGRFSRLTTADGLPSNIIRSLYQDGDGWIWVGTEGRGLARLPPGGTSGAIAVYRRNDGLHDDVIHQILEDDLGRLWMSSNRGIFWVTRAELAAFARGKIGRIHATAYTERDGLRNREANGGMQPAGIKARDGRLWFPTQNGAVVVDPTRLHRNDVPPPVVIEAVVAGDRSLRAASGPVALAAPQRNFEIKYTALSFMAPENVRFRYRLEGLNADWVDAGNRRTAFYTNVPPGQYTFRVVASNNAGVWNETGASLALSVAPYFYERTEYRLLGVLAVVLAIVGGVRVRFRTLRRRERELIRVVEARTVELRRHDAQLEAQNAQLAVQAEKLTALDRAKSRFFTNVSHEFRTPLTLTIGPLEDVHAGLHGPLPDDAGRQVGLALRNARRLLRLVNQILDLAKLEAGQLRLSARRADLGDLVQSALAAFAPAAERKRIAVHADLPAAPVEAYVDPDLLERVLLNLLSNAFKFTPAGGAITVELSEEGARGEVATIAVTDSGSGIPASELPHIFERFHQGEAAGARAQPGTGIGLSLAKELVELHGGSIGVESRDGAGATFTVRLPLGQEHFRDDEVVHHEPPVSAEALPPDFELAPRAGVAANGQPDVRPDADVTTVLVVDDNPEVRGYVRSHLERRYRVLEAAGGAEGIALARRSLPDLVVADLMMPDIDGYALCRALRQDPETDFIPVILLTAKAAVEDRIEGLGQGADDYLIKPFNMRELQARVDNLITSRRRVRERLAEPPRLGRRTTAAMGPPADSAYLERVHAAIEANLHNEHFGVAELASEVGQDRSHLYRRLRDLTGETPSALIRRLRLERAAALLAARAGSVAEIAYEVGFNSVSYFCQCFRAAYGTTPAAYRGERQEV